MSNITSDSYMQMVWFIFSQFMFEARPQTRNKKSITDSDILIASQKASEQKMPCYFLHKGKLTKKGIEMLEQYKNLVKIDKIDKI